MNNKVSKYEIYSQNCNKDLKTGVWVAYNYAWVSILIILSLQQKKSFTNNHYQSFFLLFRILDQLQSIGFLADDLHFFGQWLQVFASSRVLISKPISLVKWNTRQQGNLFWIPWYHIYSLGSFPSNFLSELVPFITYIHNWPLQPFSQDYWPSFSHHLCCVC